ncbi:tape measure protein [Ottowia sp. GY511]|uniref:Tape measure protein n=1 Tax=Ottowia flava TaxID=2675430 RepID=A0ABW4KRK9_9BURK|nr:tape measure protein [Ottowia sp. GY511]TXK26494.1 tape measure protein [Ottowia sp. GY511]
MADPKIKYDISANVSGDADVEKLASEIERLGKTLDGDLKVKADQAANALRELGNKNQAAANFFDLKQKTLDAAKALGEAQAAAQAMAREIAQSDAPTKTQAAQLEKLKDAVKAANAEYLNSQNALTQARSALGNYGLSVDGLAKNQQVLKRELAQAKEAAASLSGELAQQAAAQRSAEQAAKEQAAALKQANAAAREAATAAKEASTATSGWAASIGKIAAGNVLANVFSSITSKVQETGRAFVEANIQLDGMRRAMTAIYGSAGVAEQQIAFLRKTSNEAGVSFAALGDSFKSFAAASHAANIPISVTNELFASVTKASATLGLSGERTSLVLQALGQMASKGTVSMEELRQQLGESLPGALSLAAKGLGLTEQQLIKLVESGGLAARDLFPALAESLKSMQGANDGLQGSWERLKTAINGVMTSIGDAGGMQVMTMAVKGLAVALGVVMVPLQGLVELLTGLGRTIGAAAASIGILADRSLTTAQKITALKEVGTQLKESFDAADARMQTTANAFVGVATGADTATRSIAATAATAGTSSAAFAQLSQQWVAIGQTMGEAGKAQEEIAKNGQKLADAAKSEGEALNTLAQLRGNEVEQLEVAAAASENYAAKLDAVASARRNALEIAQAELTAKENLIAGDEAEQKARAEHIKSLTEKVEKLKAESEASSKSAESARSEALAKKIAADANKDHSAQVEKSRTEMVKAIEVQQRAKAELDAGKISQEQYNKAQDAATTAIARYNDALADKVRMIQAESQSRQAALSAQSAGLQIALQEAQVEERLYTLQGNTQAAEQARMRQREIAIEIMRVEQQAEIALAEAKIAELQATKAQLEAEGKLEPARRLSIDAAIKAAETQKLVAESKTRLITLQQAELNHLREFGEKSKQAARDGVASTDEIAEGWSRVSKSIQGAAYDAQKFALDSEGRRLSSVEPEAQMNQRIAKLFGEGAIGMKEAIEAANIKIKLDEAAKYGVANVPGNQEYYTNLRREYERLSAIVEATGKSGGGAALGRPDKSGTSAGGASGGGMASGQKAQQGVSYVSNMNINIPGGQGQIRYADLESQKFADKLFRDVANARSASA